MTGEFGRVRWRGAAREAFLRAGGAWVGAAGVSR